MNEVFSKLAETLDISNKGLEKLIESVGGVNYAEVYQILVREYMIYTLADRLYGVGWVVFFLFGIPTAVIGFTCITDELEFPKFYKKIFFMMCFGFLLIVLSRFAPIFYPNINLLLELIKE